MNTLAQSVRVGLFIILGVSLIWIAYEALSEKTVTEHRSYTLKAPFKNLKQLTPGDDVRMAGVKIGTVQTTHLEAGRAVALLLIENAYTVPSDVEATIATTGLLGSNFVSLSLGSRQVPPLPEGATLKTVPSADLNTVLTELSMASKQLKRFLGGSGGGYDTFFTKLNAILDDNHKRIETTLENFQTVSQRLVDGKGTLGKLINEDESYETIRVAAKNVSKAADNANALMTEVRAFVSDIKESKSVGTLLTSDQLAKDLEETVANFRAFSEKLNSEEGTLGKLISDDSLYREVQTVLKKAERTLDGVSEAGPLTAVGVAANALF